MHLRILKKLETNLIFFHVEGQIFTFFQEERNSFQCLKSTTKLYTSKLLNDRAQKRSLNRIYLLWGSSSGNFVVWKIPAVLTIIWSGFTRIFCSCSTVEKKCSRLQMVFTSRTSAESSVKWNVSNLWNENENLFVTRGIFEQKNQTLESEIEVIDPFRILLGICTYFSGTVA